MPSPEIPVQPTALDRSGGSHLVSGFDADQQNALYDALVLAAAEYALTVPDEAKRGTDVKSAIYQFVEETPATSMVYELTKALNTLGWRISRASVVRAARETDSDEPRH